MANVVYTFPDNEQPLDTNADFAVWPGSGPTVQSEGILYLTMYDSVEVRARYIKGDALTGDQEVTAVVRMKNGWNWAGPLARCSSDGSFYGAAIITSSDPGNEIRLLRSTAGGALETLGQWSDGILAGENHKIALRAEGGGGGTPVTLTVRANDGPPHVFVDESSSKLASGTPGLIGVTDENYPQIKAFSFTDEFSLGGAPTGLGASTEAADISAGSAKVAVTGTGGSTEAADVSAGIGGTGRFSTGASTEAADASTGTGFYNPTHKLLQFSIFAPFVQTGPDSLGAALVGAAVTGDQTLLPSEDGAGNAIVWEVDGNGRPSLRIASMAGSGNADNLPWRYYNGSNWLTAAFSTRASVITNVAAIGASTEARDIAAGTGSVRVSGAGSSTEARDLTAGLGSLAITGIGSTTEGKDIASGGTGRYGVGASTEAADIAHGTGTFSTEDDTDPQVEISVSTAGIIHTFTAVASDNVGVVSVQFFINGQPAGQSLTHAPWLWDWSTAGQLNGNYNVTAQARDIAGNTAWSNTIQVAVSGSVTPGQGAPFSRGGSATFEQKDSVWHQITE